MHMVVYTLLYGNYRFIAEVDTGSETGVNQISLWYSQKLDINNVALTQFKIDKLLEALKEPERSFLTTQWQEVQWLKKKLIEAEITELQRPYLATTHTSGKKLPSTIKRKIKEIRQQINSSLRQMERDFIRDELLVLTRDRFDHKVLEQESQNFEESRFLRAFYFEEANDDNIRAFCREFAMNAEYQQEILQGKRRWVKRNELFVRNLPLLLNDEDIQINEGRYFNKAYELFRWLDIHTEEILLLPAYRRLQEIDNHFQPTGLEIDPLIEPAATLLNQLPGVKTRFSCQGVSGKIHFQDREILAISLHEEYAYVAFEKMGYLAHDMILQLLPHMPHVTCKPLPHNYVLRLVLRSTGDNLKFRQELKILAEKLADQLKNINFQEKDLKAPLYWETAIYPELNPAPATPAGMLPSRLTWLCQTERIERTLQLLYHLNHWAKAFEELRYADRQGLYEVKTVILQQAYREGSIQATAYIDGIKAFAKGYNVEIASMIATEIFLEQYTQLQENAEGTFITPDTETERNIWQFYQQIKKELETCEIEKDKEELVTKFIQNRLQILIEQAQQTREPLSAQALEALFIGPTDLLDIPRYLNSWHELDNGDKNKLDPEGASLIAFEYNSEQAYYRFHLPYRTATKFLEEKTVKRLQAGSENKREQGEIYGRPITEEESALYPIKDILHELGVHSEKLFPHHLERKTEQRTKMNNWYDTDWEEAEDYSEDSHWPNDHTLQHTKRSVEGKPLLQKRPTKECPQCRYEVDEIGEARLAHWQQAHGTQDLTISGVAWIFGKQSNEVQTLAPDYRGRYPQARHNRTRFWKISTIQAALSAKKDN